MTIFRVACEWLAVDLKFIAPVQAGSWTGLKCVVIIKVQAPQLPIGGVNVAFDPALAWRPNKLPAGAVGLSWQIRVFKPIGRSPVDCFSRNVMMVARRSRLAAWTAMALAATVLPVAGCGSASDSTTETENNPAAAADAKTTTVAQVGDGTEHYQYIPKKKPTDESGLTEVKPIVAGSQKYTYPPQSKTPEVSADITVFSDKSIKFNGDFREFRSDGKTPHAVGAFKNDHRDGKWTYYHPNGKVAKEVTYVDGRLNGSWTHFAESGAKILDATYKNGVRDGTWTHYSTPEKEGDKQYITQTTQYVGGTVDGAQINFYPDGKKQLERFYKANRQIGKQTMWYASGAKASEANLEDGQLNGMVTRWDENGKVLMQVEYRKNKPVPKQNDEKPAAAKTESAKPAEAAPAAK
jgi:antitoxin component YwqK of YwqJK toxin-antitoxin module